MLTLEEAKTLVSQEKLEKLKELVHVAPSINVGNKSQCDILMKALCDAVTADRIKASNLSEKIVRLLNSTTTTLSNIKLNSVLTTLRKRQPNIVCRIWIDTNDMKTTLNSWTLTGSGSDASFNDIFRYVVTTFEITPQLVRTKMTETLKPTIVNNIAQLIAKYELDPELHDTNVSIHTITRLVNMQDHMIFAEFVEADQET